MKIFKKEREVAEQALEYVEVAERCVEAARVAVAHYLAGEADEASVAQKEASDLETTADVKRRAIGDLLFSGAYLPTIRGDLYGVIEAMDKVPNAAEACCGFFLSERPVVPEGLREGFVELLEESFGAVVPLRKAMRGFFRPKGDIDKIRKQAHEVSIRESRVDDLEWALTVSIFGLDGVGLAEKLHLKQAVGRVVHLSDVAENVADRLELTAIKSVL